MALVELRAAGYRYPAAAGSVFERLDLDIEPGLTLVEGASGSGKSTLLRLLNGLVPHFHGGVLSGAVTVCGLDVAATPVRRLATRTGFVFQDPEAQLLQSTVDREVGFGPANLGLPRRGVAARVEEALARAGATHLHDRAVATLSGGERQRVAIAAALAMRPRILALDEPASQLDPDGAAAVAGLCRELADRDTAVVLAEPRLRALRPGARIVSLAEDPAITAPEMPQPVPAETSWSLEGVTAGFDGRPVLSGFSLEGRAGEAIALTGPNGGGKTTVLRVIAGLLTPQGGRVWRAAGRVAYLPQNPTALLHPQTVQAEVRWTLERSGSPGLVEPPLAELGLAALAQRYPRDLSGGERQRAAVAAVLAGNPKIALLDEPTRGMDRATRVALTRVLAGLRGDGCSVVVATHDAELIAMLGAREVVVGAAKQIGAYA